MPSGSFQVPLPPNSTIRISGLTNSGSWTQQITVTPPGGGAAIVWQGTGGQGNQVIGQVVIGPYPTAEQELTISMAYDMGDGTGFHPHDVKTDVFNMAGLSGYVIGGQDGGGRVGPAYWNAIAFIYWAEGY